LDIPAFLDSAGEVTSAIAAIKLEDVNADVLAVDDTWDTWVSPGPVPRQQNRSEAAPLKSVLHEGVQREADLNAELQNRHWQADRAIDSLNGREICGIGCRVLFIRAFMLESRLPEPFALPEIEMYCFGTVGTATECAEKLRDAFDEFGLIELTGPPPTTRHAAIRLQDPKWFQWWKKRSLIIDVIARIKEREAMPPGPLKLEHYDAGLYAGADPSTQK
jgi:hypothetical protein